MNPNETGNPNEIVRSEHKKIASELSRLTGAAGVIQKMEGHLEANSPRRYRDTAVSVEFRLRAAFVRRQYMSLQIVLQTESCGEVTMTCPIHMSYTGDGLGVCPMSQFNHVLKDWESEGAEDRARAVALMVLKDLAPEFRRSLDRLVSAERARDEAKRAELRESDSAISEFLAGLDTGRFNEV